MKFQKPVVYKFSNLWNGPRVKYIFFRLAFCRYYELSVAGGKEDVGR